MILRPLRDTPGHDGDPILPVRVIGRDDYLVHRRRPGVLHGAGTLGELLHLLHPDDLPIDQLRQRTWLAVEPLYRARLAARVEQFSTARAKGLGHDELAEVAAAALAGRVATLQLEADRVVPGRIDTATGEVVLDDLANPSVDDVLDDLGELVARMGGEVIMVPGPEMPTTTGIAAINRH